jgi:hypothetical protein
MQHFVIIGGVDERFDWSAFDDGHPHAACVLFGDDSKVIPKEVPSACPDEQQNQDRQQESQECGEPYTRPSRCPAAFDFHGDILFG